MVGGKNVFTHKTGIVMRMIVIVMGICCSRTHVVKEGSGNIGQADGKSDLICSTIDGLQVVK